jgi:environmental stress-induced protein Ves
MIRVLAPADYRVMPWKNGGGTTTEIWIHPPGAGWDAFEWRVGIADIAQSGPFSKFEGIDRSIMLLECPPKSGMRLSIDGRDVVLPFQEFVDFAGESPTHGTLLGAPVRDFNVMSRRSRMRHQRGWLPLAAGATHALPAAAWAFVHAIDGDAAVASGRERARLQARESAVADGGAALQVTAGSSGARIVWAVLSPAA